MVSKSEPVSYYLPTDEIFDIIQAAHLAVWHGGRERCRNDTSRKYVNVMTEVVNIFLPLCETFSTKEK